MKKTAKTPDAKRAAEIESLWRHLQKVTELPDVNDESRRAWVWQIITAVAEAAQSIDAELFRKSPLLAIKQAIELWRAIKSLPYYPPTWETQAAMARIAARMNPELCKSNPEKAAHLARETILTGGRALVGNSVDSIVARASKLGEEVRVSFEHGVKWITGEKNLDRALSKFEKFMASAFTKDGEAAEWIKRYKSKAFTGTQVARFHNAFVPWWKQEKSSQARKSALANKKRGRVKRPQSDLRFTKNRRHKEGYCQKCGKRVRKGERLCDKHLSGKPILVKPKASVFSDKAGPVGEIDATLSTLAQGTDALPDTYEHLYEHLDGETEA